VALILAGGAARGAYEVGVVQYILGQVAKDLGRDLPIDILCGTSVGAINACMLAAHAHEPAMRADKLAHTWKDLKLDQVARPSRTELFGLFGGLLGRKRPPPEPGAQRRGGLFDPRGVELIVRRGMHPGAIRRNLQSRRLSALTVSTTNVGSGKTVIFVERSEPGLPPWNQDPTIVVRAAEITAEHALASAAVPPLFPAVRLEGDFYCDGGLRQNVPLSPARRLGADGLIVVNPRHIPDEPLIPKIAAADENEADYPGPFFLLGKALNALLLDRIDNDIDRLNRINIILEAGTRRFGPKFVDELNQELGTKGRLRGFRPLRVVHIRASQDIGLMAAEYARSPEFASRSSGVMGRLIRRLGEWGAGEADFLSYILFDGEFSARLIELGHNDARSRHDELCTFFDALAPAREGAKAV
jgi:NTE family protein